jgi:broad specificity phosphatase PhoE
MTCIVVARHGNTFEADQEPLRIGRHTDLELTDEGRRQARALGDALAHAGWTPDVIVSGPLARARHSAELIAAVWADGMTMDRADWLDEIDHGPDEGQLESSVVERIGADALHDWDSAGIAPAGWQVDADWRLAQWRDFFAVSARNHRSALCVTSNGAARFALLAADLPALPAQLKLRTGACGAFGWSASAWHRLFWDWRPGEPGLAMTPPFHG